MHVMLSHLRRPLIAEALAGQVPAPRNLRMRPATHKAAIVIARSDATKQSRSGAR